ncbi:MAG TPA: ABC transporter permease [Blastocatellia bacterium]|nr:ABC transporter permease [Blastocatellia bacterium]
MIDSNHPSRFRFWLWLIRGIGVIVPRRLRADWRQEWQAELSHRELLLAEWDRLNWRNRLDLLWRSTSAFWDALWMQTYRWEDAMIQDLRFGLRIMAKKPGFTLVAVLTLALGIGANLTIFSFVDTFFLRPVPAREHDRLVIAESSRNGGLLRDYNVSYPAYLNYRDHTQSFEALAAHYSTAPMNVVIEGDSRVANGAVVSANYFSMLGIQPHLGRFFLPEEDVVPDRDPVVVISHRMWQRYFGGDPSVLGKELNLNGSACQIIGVAPQDFPGVLAGFANEFWLPTMMLRLGYRWCDGITEADCRPLSLLGRLAKGRTLSEAEAELNLLARRLAPASPAEQERVISLRPAVGVRRDEREGFVYQMQLLMAVTGLLLLIACANVASLLLVRGAARRKEIAVRLCIGAGRWRLIRQFLTESLLLALAGGALGLLISGWAREALSGFYTTTYSSLQLEYDLSLSPRGLIYAFALTLLTGLLFGLLPAFQATRHDLVSALKDGAAPGQRHHRVRGALVIGQVALSLALLVAAGLLIRSESHVRQGANFDPQHVAAFRLRPALVNYPAEKARAYVSEVVRGLEATPGVQSVTWSSGSGLAWLDGGELRVRLPEQASLRPEYQPTAEHQRVALRFCETLRIPLLQGREFNEADEGSARRVVVINETLARHLWPEGWELESTLMLDDQPYQVVGITKDAQLRNLLEGPMPFVYLPYWVSNQKQLLDARFLVRVAGDPQTMLGSLRRAIVAIDPDVPISEDVPLTQQVNAIYKPVMLTSAVLSWAGALAFFLSMLGLYGVLAFAVSQRTREIGIRMALGAKRHNVLRLVIAQGLRLALAGVAIGLLAAYAATRLISSLLYGVSATDSLTFAVIPALLLGVALLACWLPARRATKVDPMVALRYE